ncbi:hypothetical protein TNIN_40491 [Trichonephila inaurata madagascariensis]|uniref:Uncharacterized protein n=1 Tax=Trichonephila inaurata madagascariensis TaxID=2747483 RepID=A0A8X7C6A2_9ARAC|nr:hypothetical protein TNIN_40491 [Trichonephila inaurata madagascariensis]
MIPNWFVAFSNEKYAIISDHLVMHVLKHERVLLSPEMGSITFTRLEMEIALVLRLNMDFVGLEDFDVCSGLLAFSYEMCLRKYVTSVTLVIVGNT